MGWVKGRTSTRVLSGPRAVDRSGCLGWGMREERLRWKWGVSVCPLPWLELSWPHMIAREPGNLPELA